MAMLSIEERLELLKNKLKEKEFWTALIKEEWPFIVEVEGDKPEKVRELAKSLLTALANNRIAELEASDDTTDTTPIGPTEEEKAKVFEVQQILAKYKQNLGKNRNKGLDLTVNRKSVSILDVKPAAHHQPSVKFHGLDLTKLAILVDMQSIESQNPTHKSEFVVGDEVKIAKIYEHPTIKRMFADIIKNSPSKGPVRAKVPVDDLEQ